MCFLNWKFRVHRNFMLSKTQRYTPRFLDKKKSRKSSIHVEGIHKDFVNKDFIHVEGIYDGSCQCLTISTLSPTHDPRTK